MHSAIDDVPGVVGIAGTGATVRDYTEAVFKRFPLVMALIAFVTFLLLVRAFRSLLLPLKAVVLNVLSVAATFGFVVWFWQHGHGSKAVFDIVPTGAITFWVPVVIFAFLFGLSMDYEVFILSRMREEYDKTGSTKQAVVEGLGRTGRIVTCAALILFMAFIALAASPGTDVKVLATALGVGILLDATVVRALMVPALVSLFGRWNWYLPAWLAKPLRLEPSPPRPSATSSTSANPPPSTEHPGDGGAMERGVHRVRARPLREHGRLLRRSSSGSRSSTRSRAGRRSATRPGGWASTCRRTTPTSHRYGRRRSRSSR